MRTPYSSIATMLFTVIALIPGNSLLNTLVPLRGKLEGFADVSIGLMGSVYFAAMLAGTLVSPLLIKRLGYVNAYAVFAAIGAAATIAHPFLLDPGWWMALRAVLGFCIACLYSMIDGWVQGKADNENRGRMGAAYQFTHFIGSSIGQALIVAADPRDHTLFAVGAALFALSILPLVLSRSEPPARPATARIELGWLMRNSPVAATAVVAVGVANGSFWSLFPVFGVAIGLSNAQISAFLTLTVIGSAAAIWPLGRLSDRMDRRVVMAGQMAVATALELALAALGGALGWGLGAFGFLIGCSSMTIYSIASSHANDRAEPAKSLAVASGLLFFYCVGAIAGPVIAVAMMEALRPQALFLFMALSHAAVLAVTVLRITQRAPAVPRETKPTLPP